jgi:hypothetical protein
MSFTAAFIAALVGTVLTVFFAYFPKVRVWYANLAPEYKAYLNLSLMIVVAGAIFGLSFTSIFPPPLTWTQLLSVVVALILANEPVAQLLPPLPDVRTARKAQLLRYIGK